MDQIEIHFNRWFLSLTSSSCGFYCTTEIKTGGMREVSHFTLFPVQETCVLSSLPR